MSLWDLLNKEIIEKEKKDITFILILIIQVVVVYYV